MRNQVPLVQLAQFIRYGGFYFSQRPNNRKSKRCTNPPSLHYRTCPLHSTSEIRFRRSKICPIPKQSRFQTLSKIWTKIFGFRMFLNVWNLKKVVRFLVIWVFIVVKKLSLNKLSENQTCWNPNCQKFGLRRFPIFGCSDFRH